jgi:uncharacterized protein
MRAGPVAPSETAAVVIRPLGFDAVRFDGGFWGQRQHVNREVSLPGAVQRLREAGNLANLRMAAGGITGSYRGPVFMDSDVYKVLEALAWEHGRAPAAHLAAAIGELAALVRAAQSPDGYVNSYVQVTRGGADRYADLVMGHELYCIGHLLQAAVAAHRVSLDDDLWPAALAAADHLTVAFGANDAVEGHPIVEMALVELYRETGTTAYLDLASHFVDARGRAQLRGHGREPSYFSDRVPVREATSVEGHAVRAMYLAAGAADVVAEGRDDAGQGLATALRRQWQHMVQTKTYLTGGLGSRWDGEAFGDPYELPPDRAYAETCAAIGSVQWAWRMLLATGDAAFADLIERTLFNGFAAGVSRSGDEYFYVNALQVRAEAAPQDHRSPALGRHGWFDVACCPPNIMRTLASLHSYLATSDGAGLQIHQYGSATISHALADEAVELRMRTDYPWSGEVGIEVLSSPDAEWTLSLRVPQWCPDASITVNGADPAPAAPGYVRLTRRWRSGDQVRLELPMPPRLTQADPQVDAARGCVAVERGPLVYCVEQVDQPAGLPVGDLMITAATLTDEWRAGLLGGVVAVHLRSAAFEPASTGLPYHDATVRAGAPAQPRHVLAVPYCLWANRGPGAMRVWLACGPELLSQLPPH